MVLRITLNIGESDLGNNDWYSFIRYVICIIMIDICVYTYIFFMHLLWNLPTLNQGHSQKISNEWAYMIPCIHT